jgi:hypothetical protein
MEHLQAQQEVRETMRFRLSTRQPGLDAYVIAVEGELDLFRAPELKELFPRPRWRC